MKNTRKLIMAILALCLLCTACGAPPTETAVHPSQQVEPPQVEVDEQPGNNAEGDVSPVANLILDEYDGIAVTAAILERKAILPGAAIPVQVTVANTGDKTISYVQGSGSHTTPAALLIEADGLQVVRYKDHLGFATMDFVTKELKPGESVNFTVYVMAVEPHASFSDYTDEVYKDNQQYIAELEWAKLQEDFPALTAAANGSYNGRAYLRYYVLEEGAGPMLTQEPTGYAQGDFLVNITG